MVLIQCCNCLGICPNRNNSFFRYKDGPGNAIKCTFEGGLKDLVSANRSRGTRKMYYSKVCASLGFQKTIVIFLGVSLVVPKDKHGL